ncbi:hypothetical protein BH20ACT23_BH20ACT23_28700 [soil metagenome]
MLSVLTLVKNRTPQLHNLLKGPVTGEQLPNEVVVVVMGGTDPEPEIDVPQLRIRYLRMNCGGLPLARARNLAARAACQENLVFLDVDCIPSTQLISSYENCHYEERYFVWTPGETWWVKGRLKHSHSNKRLTLQRSKRGHNWRTWKRSRSLNDGRYKFRGVAPRRGARWWVNLRVAMPAQGGHGRTVSRSMYIDTNPATRCR